MSLTLWLFGIGNMNLANSVEAASTWNQVAHIGIVMISPTFLNFTIRSLGLYNKLQVKLNLIWLCSVVLIAFVIFEPNLFNTPNQYLYGFYPSYNSYSTFILIFNVIIIPFCGFLFLNSYTDENDSEKSKNRSKLIFSGFAVVGVIGISDYIPAYGVDIYPIGYLGILYLIIVTTIVVIKYHYVYFIPEFSYDQIINSIDEGLIIADSEGFIRQFNPAATVLFKPFISDLNKKNLLNVMSKFELNFNFNVITDILKKDSLILEIKHDSKSQFFRINVTPHFDYGTELTAYIVIFHDITESRIAEIAKEKAISELQKALEEIKTLQGIVPICASCKKIRDDNGFWEQVESYISKHSHAQFSHSICPECTDELYPEYSNRTTKDKS